MLPRYDLMRGSTFFQRGSLVREAGRRVEVASTPNSLLNTPSASFCRSMMGMGRRGMGGAGDRLWW